VEWKKLCAEKIIGMIERIHPGFRDCIENMNMSSPLTIRDFYGVKEGAITGYSKDCNNIIVSQIPVVTKVKNLLLTGQNINLHGFCGVALTAISTCEVLLGQNYIINKINTRKE
jgi:all-trans-retinol 13,14-reductase